jgi:hypothetical protein
MVAAGLSTEGAAESLDSSANGTSRANEYRYAGIRSRAEHCRVTASYHNGMHIFFKKHLHAQLSRYRPPESDNGVWYHLIAHSIRINNQ